MKCAITLTTLISPIITLFSLGVSILIVWSFGIYYTLTGTAVTLFTSAMLTALLNSIVASYVAVHLCQ